MQKTVNSIDYQFGKISALAQFHIVRRLAPMIGEIIPAVTAISKKGNLDPKDLANSEESLKLLEPVISSISKLSDSDANYVIFELLKPVSRKVTNAGGWAKVVNGEHFMYDDIDMPTMLRLCGFSLMHNLGGFISALPAGLKEGALQEETIAG